MGNPVYEQIQARKVKARLRMLQHAQRLSGNVSQTCRFFGVSGLLYYIWKKRFERAARRSPVAARFFTFRNLLAVGIDVSTDWNIHAMEPFVSRISLLFLQARTHFALDSGSAKRV